MITIRIPIIERKVGAQERLFNKLSQSAQKLFIIIARLSQSAKGGISIDDIRNLNVFGTTKEIEALLYTLEARGFGEVKINGAETYFIANKALMQSVL
jgi:hypothetical protein